MRVLLVLFMLPSLACLELEGRPCTSAADCIAGFACTSSICVATAGEGEGEPLVDTRCPQVPRGAAAFDQALPAGQLLVEQTGGDVLLVYGGDEDRVLSTSAGIEIDAFEGFVDVTGTSQDTVLVLSAVRSLIEVDTTSGGVCLDEPEGVVTATTASGPVDLFATLDGAATAIQLDSGSGDMHARIGASSDVSISIDTNGAVTTDPAFACFGADPTTCLQGSGESALQLDSTSGNIELSPL